jgi:hypothetical protein
VPGYDDIKVASLSGLLTDIHGRTGRSPPGAGVTGGLSSYRSDSVRWPLPRPRARGGLVELWYGSM